MRGYQGCGDADSRLRRFPRRGVNPLVTLQQDVVIGDCQEIVTVLLVPIDDHLREIVAVAPVGMGVQVALPVPRAVLPQRRDSTRALILTALLSHRLSRSIPLAATQRASRSSKGFHTAL